MKRPKLAKLELRILDALWARGRASMREIQEVFPEPRPAYTTITNTVYRMEAKHAVRRVRKIGNADIFEPLIAKDAARALGIQRTNLYRKVRQLKVARTLLARKV